MCKLFYNLNCINLSNLVCKNIIGFKINVIRVNYFIIKIMPI